MVASMKPGSVLIDLAVERGGNVEGAKAGEIVTTANGVKIVGYTNVPGRLAPPLRRSTQEPSRFPRDPRGQEREETRCEFRG